MPVGHSFKKSCYFKTHPGIFIIIEVVDREYGEGYEGNGGIYHVRNKYTARN